MAAQVTKLVIKESGMFELVVTHSIAHNMYSQWQMGGEGVRERERERENERGREKKERGRERGRSRERREDEI